MSVLLRPASALLARLRFAQKFALIGLVLLLPLGWVSWGFVSQQSTQLEFSAKERTGLEYVVPATALLAEVVAARSVAVEAATEGRPVPAPPPSLARSVAALAGVDQRLGASLGTTSSWTDLRSSLDAVSATSGTRARGLYDRYSEITSGLQALIVTAGNESNLILDPDLDSYYLMETLVTRLPPLIDNAGRVVDLLRVASSDTGPDTGPDLASDADVRVAAAEFTLTQAAVSTNAEAVASNLATAVAKTRDGRLAAEVRAPGQELQATYARYASSLVGARAGVPPDSTHSSDRLRSVALDVGESVAPALDRLLVTRIAGFASTQTGVVAGALLATLVAGYLFLGLYTSLRRSVRSMLEGTSRLAGGDFTQPVEVLTRDELAEVSRGMNDAVERMRVALTEITGHSQALGSASRRVTGVSAEIAGLAQETSSQAHLVSAAADEVAQQVQIVVNEQLAASVNDFAETAATTSRVLESANAAVDSVVSTGEMVTRLGESGAEIGEVMQFITAMAAQTRLLALNATIEAARAGEAGLGFAVVAHEVKELARETAEAAESIGSRIAAIQTDTTAAVSAASSIRGEIEGIRGHQTLVSVAMEEQTANAGVIREALGDAVVRSGSIARDVGGFAASAERTTAGASELQTSASAMAGMAGELEELVGRFRV